jgi:hypothetical protein
MGFLRTMRQTQAKKFQREADQCRLNAEQTTNIADKRAWRRLADDWTRLARLADLCGSDGRPVPSRLSQMRKTVNARL